jgi:hypothetical protein
VSNVGQTPSVNECILLAWQEETMDNSLGNKSMSGFFHYDRLAEKLEIARTIGFASDYFVGPIGPARRPEVIVKMRRGSSLTRETIRDYLMRLLYGVASDYEIIVTSATAEAEAVATGVPTSGVLIIPEPLAA